MCLELLFGAKNALILKFCAWISDDVGTVIVGWNLCRSYYTILGSYHTVRHSSEKTGYCQGYIAQCDAL